MVRVINEKTRKWEGLDETNFPKIKDKILAFIKDPNKKSCKIISIHDNYSGEEASDIYDEIITDEDIENALKTFGYIGKLSWRHNRYATTVPEFTMTKVVSKRGNSGWSSWTK